MLAATALAVLALARPALAVTEHPATRAGAAEAFATALGNELRSRDYSGVVVVAAGDDVLVREAHGLADAATGRANTVDTPFNLGSINKAFTRVAVEQLVAEGRLQLSDTLDRWVPEYPADKGRRITIEHLLEHRAGTGDVFGPEWDTVDRTKLRELRDWLPLFADRPLQFDPGSRQEYSNAGYVLLGLVVEKVTGQTYRDRVREHVFAPADMTHAGFPLQEEAVTFAAVGLTRRAGAEPGANTSLLPARGTSAGGGYATADDLLAFARALRAGRFGKPVQGLGIAGGAPGVSAVLEVDGPVTIVALANADPPAAMRIAERMGELLEEHGLAASGPDQPGVVRKVVRASDVGQPMARPRRTVLPDAGIDVPMRRAGHMPAVDVMVNGQGPFLFAIDTGGAGTLRIDDALAERLGLPQVGEVRAGDPSGRNTRTMPVVEVETLQLGDARFEGVAGALRDYGEQGGQPVDGVLGFGLFAEGTVSLDYPGSRVRFDRGALPPADGRAVLAYTDDDGVPSVILRVAGRDLTAHVDSGAMGGFILPEEEAEELPLAEPPRVVGRARTVANTFEIKAAPLDGEVVLGGLTFARPMVELQPLFPMANVGARVLQDLVVTFDLRSKTVRFERPAAGSGRRGAEPSSDAPAASGEG